MRTTPRTTNLVVHTQRSFLILSLIITGIIGFAEIEKSTQSAGLNPAEVATLAGETYSTMAPLSTYSWNLNDQDRPLLSLPDHIGPEFDLSLTYSMDQFQFPLFQQLRYNPTAGKYLFMVIQSEGRRLGFINLGALKVGESEAKGYSGVSLTDEGRLKLIRTVDGSIYTFALLPNGELHCSQITAHNGAVINLKYNADASITSIADGFGRKISFTYTDDYASSITQTWGPSKKQIWAIADDNRPNLATNLLPVGSEIGKHIPTNAITPVYTYAMGVSDQTLALIFGGPGAIAAANGFEPAGLGSQYPLYRGGIIAEDGKILRGHLSYAMHLYGSADGTGDTNLYVPNGFTSNSNTPTPTDAAVTFYYPRLGNLTDVTLAVFHIANFKLSYEGSRVHIGNIGGRGGSSGGYKHSHLEFYRGDTGLPSAASRTRLRIDPIGVFGTTSDIAARK